MNNAFNFQTRSDFPVFLNKCGLIGTGVEVGVQEGIFSEHILNHWKGSTLFSIDAWQNFDASEYIGIANRADDQQICLYANTTLRLRPFGERSIVWRMTSEQAASVMSDNTLDFCYIDADHRYEAAKQDIDLWLPKVKSGGIICGHDYVSDGNLYNKADGSLIGLFGVQRAVKEFAIRHNCDVHVTESESWPSWFAFKP
ncbi:MAG: class I SAM-dependent methyltransferase [Verrucomicrobiota bacterium]|jgi:hypothetical protein|nr:class I SAM-dependent methyltransferase [Verrucomicrobiota bacterium]